LKLYLDISSNGINFSMSTHRFHPVKFFFMQKDLTEVKIFQKVLGGLLFLKHPVFSNATKLKMQHVLVVVGFNIPLDTLYVISEMILQIR